MSWHSFSAYALSRAAHFNENFDFLEGTIVPHFKGAFTDNAYDLGSSTYKYRTAYIANAIIVAGSTISSFDNSTLEVGAGNIRIKSQGVRGSTANSGGTEREIVQGTISMPDLRASSVHQYVQSGSGSQNTGTTTSSVQITTLGGPVMITAFANIPVDRDGNVSHVQLSIDRDGTALTGMKQDSIVNGGIGNPSYHTVGLMGVDNPAAGTYTYNLKYTIVVGTLNAGAMFRRIAAVEMRR